jgi:fatty acid desaturase
MSELAKDAAYGFRQLRRSPGFAATAVLSLALGLAAGTLMALWAGRAATSLLYGLKPSDPLTT